MINRLLTTFKLKSYIINRLKEQGLSPIISLAQYHSVSKRKVLLNFSVIDVNKQSLTFLNKNSTPNMPLWAAIIASSSLPFYHKFFEGRKEWTATDKTSFFKFFMLDFFRAEPDTTNRITHYTSANLISSVPLQLLTNKTLKNEIFSSKSENNKYSKYKTFALCFNTSYSYQKMLDMQVTKKYLNVPNIAMYLFIYSDQVEL